MEEIVIMIEENGSVVIEGVNFKDAECTKLTHEIEQALGTVTKRNLKPEHRHGKTVLKKAGA
jgi:hypothetical protein